MDDALLVRGFNGIRDLLCDWEDFLERNCTTHHARRQILAFDQFHDQGADIPRFFETVDVRDVRMVERREHLRFALEPREPFGIGRQTIGQDLDRDVAMELRVAGAVDLPRATLAR
jgi:hypothetical protein